MNRNMHRSGQADDRIQLRLSCLPIKLLASGMRLMVDRKKQPLAAMKEIRRLEAVRLFELDGAANAQSRNP